MNKSRHLSEAFNVSQDYYAPGNPIQLHHRSRVEESFGRCLNKILMFDFDGVLVDSFEINYSTGLISNSKKRNRKEYRELFNGNIHDGLTNSKPTDNLQRPEFYGIYGPKLMKLSPIKGVNRILKKLVADYKIIIVSSTPSSLIKLFLKKYNLIKYFTDVLGSDYNKSKVIKINHLLKKYKTTPANSLFITDTLGDILEARQCGVKSIAVSGGFQFNSTLRKGRPLKIIPNLSCLPREAKSYFKKINYG
jgi:phosphoglycolate phosphatase